LTENTLKDFSMDALFDLMIEKIQHLRSLHHDFFSEEYKQVKADIKLIQQVIDNRKKQITELN
jgi:hypothetical protein